MAKRKANVNAGMPATMEVHPIALALPAMDSDQFGDLVTSLMSYGFMAEHPIVTYQGKVLDGRSRLFAVEHVNEQRQKRGEPPIEPVFREFTGDWHAAIDFVIVENVNRRHMTASQRAASAAHLATLARGRPRKPNKCAPGAHGNPQAKCAPGAQYKPQVQRDVSGAVHVSRRLLQQAKELAEVNPEALEEVKQGRVSLKKALTEAKAAKEPPTKSSLSLNDGIVTFAKLQKALQDFKRDVTDMASGPWGRQIDGHALATDIENIKRALKFGKPAYACPIGNCDESCKLCRGQGWISEGQFHGLPDTMKKRLKK